MTDQAPGFAWSNHPAIARHHNPPDPTVPKCTCGRGCHERAAKAEAVIQAARAFLGSDPAYHANCDPPSDDYDLGFTGCEYQPLAAALRALDEDTP